jgi:hypothetical protein
MIELKAFGKLALNNGQQIPQSGPAWSIPAFLFDSRLRIVMQFLLGLGLVLLLATIVISQRWWLICVLPVVILPLGVIVGWLYYRYNLTWAQPAQLLASDEYLHRGGSIEMVLKQQVMRDVQYERIKVQIVMREWVRYSCGTSSCIEMFDHIIREHEELGPIPVAKQSSLERRVHFDLPDYLMHTFHTPDNRISWFIRVMIDTRGLPETEQFYRIELEPENLVQ